MTRPLVVQGHNVRVTPLDQYGHPAGPPQLMGGPVWVEERNRYEWALQDRILFNLRYDSQVQTTRSSMSIDTMEALAGIPIGTRIYYGENAYTRHSEGWWSTDHGDYPTVRDRHFIGAIETGQVSLEDNRALKIGTVCEDETYWYILTSETEGNNVKCTIIRRATGNVDYTDHPMGVATMRQYVMDPQPTMTPALIALADQIKEKDKVIEEFHAQVAEVRDQYRDLQAQLAGTSAFRRALKEFLDGEVPTPSSIDGVLVGDEIKAGSETYRNLPIGSVVFHSSTGTYWWKSEGAPGSPDYRWLCRTSDGSSARMSRNTLVTIGNGISTDPRTTI